MNRFLPFAAVSAIFICSGFAEKATVPGSLPPPAAATEPPKLTRFDLDFPGGTPADLFEAIQQATGKPLNVIIPEQASNGWVTPFKVTGANVKELFQSLSQTGGLFIQPSGNPEVEGTVWMTLIPQRPVCQYFQLAPYLHTHTIEDITTAMQTGWKMLGVDQAPELSFHKETKLLIAVGPEHLVNQIPMVLSQLAADETTAVEKVQRLQEEVQAIETKKEQGWEREVAERKALIENEGARIRALRALDHQARRVPPPQQLPR